MRFRPAWAAQVLFTAGSSTVVKPDILTSAKGLGGGLPIGACLCTERLSQVMGKSMHGSTFGANPVVCAGAQECS